jgi:hypothetical protein
MKSPSRFTVPIILSLLALLSAGCTKNVQIVRAPFISPVIVPAPEVFRMNVAVKNYNESQGSPDLWLRVYSEYWPMANPKPQQPPCSREDFLHVGVLAPGVSWGKADYPIDGGTNCPCVKDSCKGHVWLSLHPAPVNGPHVAGPNTALHVNWVASGNLADMSISEF